MTDYYVAAVAAGTEDGSSFANRSDAIQTIVDGLVAGDILHVCGDLTTNAITIAAPINFDVCGIGTITNRVYILGCDMATGAAYAGTGKVKITTTTDSVSALVDALAESSIPSYYRFEDITLDGGGSGKATYGFHSVPASGNGYAGMIFFRCRFTNCSSHGVYIGGINTFTFYNCEADHNGAGGTGDGWRSHSTASRGPYALIACMAYHNATNGAYANAGFTARKSLFYRNTAGDGINLSAAADSATIESCTCALNGGDGIDASGNPDSLTIYNTSLYSNGGYGYRATSTTHQYCDYNHYNGNSSGDCTITKPGSNNQTGAPNFVSETEGSEDFAVTSGSALIGTGFPGAYAVGGTSYVDIGAIQSQSSGGVSGAATGDATLPYPVYGAQYRYTFEVRDASNDLVTTLTSPDSEVSKDYGALADCTNEATAIGGGNFYLDFTPTEMTCYCLTGVVKSSNGKTHTFRLCPRVLPTVESGTAQSGASTSITLAADANADDISGGIVFISGGTGAGQARMINDYDTSTKVAEVVTWGTTPDETSTYDIYKTEYLDTLGINFPATVDCNVIEWKGATPCDLPTNFNDPLTGGVAIKSGGIPFASFGEDVPLVDEDEVVALIGTPAGVSMSADIAAVPAAAATEVQTMLQDEALAVEPTAKPTWPTSIWKSITWMYHELFVSKRIHEVNRSTGAGTESVYDSTGVTLRSQMDVTVETDGNTRRVTKEVH